MAQGHRGIIRVPVVLGLWYVVILRVFAVILRFFYRLEGGNMAEFTMGRWSLKRRIEVKEHFSDLKHDDFVVTTHDCKAQVRGHEGGEISFCGCILCIDALKKGEVIAEELIGVCFKCKEPIPEEILALFILRNNLI